MPTFVLSRAFANMQDWPGGLFQAPAGTSVLSQTATQFSFRYPGSFPDFPGLRVVVTGADFAYVGTTPVNGTISEIRLLTQNNVEVLKITGIEANAFAADLVQFHANVFGARTPGGEGPGPDGKMAWSHLMSGNDTINGTPGDDGVRPVGVDAGNDLYVMLAGNDTVNGGAGNDTIQGGAGTDQLNYRLAGQNEGMTAFRGVSVNVTSGTALDPWGGTDSFSGIESFVLSRYNDSFLGGSLQDTITGLRGRDTIDGGSNSFDLTGTTVTEDRRDVVDYSADYVQGGVRGIIVDLETAFAGGSVRGTIRDGFGTLDLVIDIERVIGTRYGDIFVGSRMDNWFTGGEGVDRYDGQAGRDLIRLDRGFLSAPTVGARVDLSRTTGQIQNDGFGNVETAVRIEDVIGTSKADVIIGNALRNEFTGDKGADTMTGGLGADSFVWTELAEFGQGDRITDFTATGPDADRLRFDIVGFPGMTETVVLVNGTRATTTAGTFLFNAANDTLSWDADGRGNGAAVAVVVLTGVASLTAANFDLFT